MKTLHSITLALLLLLFFSPRAIAQKEEDRSMLNQVEQEDQKAVDAIAMYPPDTRKEIFTAAGNPELLVRLNSVQKKTKERFDNLISGYSRDEQEKIYNLTRYPALIHDIVQTHPRSDAELNTLLSNYPEEIHKTAREEAMDKYDLLVKIDREQQDAQDDLEKIVRGYPANVANAYRDLIRYPEVLNTMYDNMQLTVVIGDVYKRDPRYVTEKTDSLNKVLTAQNEKDKRDWQESLNENPEVKKEYIDAAQQYARDNGYDPNEYSTPLVVDVNLYPSYPYDWWFGYPGWFPYGYWDPYPFWYDWGFYYGPFGQPIFFGLPSPYFMSWYFYYPEHHERYAELSNHCYNYYYGHRGDYNSVSRGVAEWRTRNRDVVNEDWDRDSKNRVQRFREYGQMENSRRTYNRGNPQHPMDRAAYIGQNRNRYPNLKAVPAKNVSGRMSPGAEPEAPYRNPHMAIPETYRSNRGKETGNMTRPATPEPSRGTMPSNNPGRALPHSSQLHEAQQFHQNRWEQVRPSAPHYSPAPHFSPAPAPHFSPPSGGGGRRH